MRPRVRCVCDGGGSASIMWLESQGELQLPLEGEEPQAAGGAPSALGGASALRVRGAGTCLGGGDRPEGPGRARFGGSGPRYCARSAGARRDVTSDGRGWVGESGAEDLYNAAVGSAGPGGVGEGSTRRPGSAPPPSLNSLWDARGLGLCGAIFH